jgi:branched-chain amino acid transport system substrate-binding protein
VPKQLHELGPKLPLIGATTSFEETVLSAVGYTMEGAISTNPWSLALDTPINKKFVSDFRKNYIGDPNWSAECGYTNMMWIKKAVDSVNGHVENKAALMAALRKVELSNAPRGPIKLDTYGNPVDNIYIRKVEMKYGKYQNTVISTYPMVSQFWNWKPEEYLKQPAYTKDFPPCTHCSSK